VLLLDANILIYAFREELPQHASARAWLLSALSGGEPIGVPTLAEIAFLRLCTKPLGPLNAATWEATWNFLAVLFGHRTSRRVVPGARHPELLDSLARRYGLKGDRLVDGWLAALALEQDATFISADHGFSRFEGLKRVNPVASTMPR
jgi:uncharacterized protein